VIFVERLKPYWVKGFIICVLFLFIYHSLHAVADPHETHIHQDEQRYIMVTQIPQESVALIAQIPLEFEKIRDLITSLAQRVEKLEFQNDEDHNQDEDLELLNILTDRSQAVQSQVDALEEKIVELAANVTLVQSPLMIVGNNTVSNSDDSESVETEEENEEDKLEDIEPVGDASSENEESELEDIEPVAENEDSETESDMEDLNNESSSHLESEELELLVDESEPTNDFGEDSADIRELKIIDGNENEKEETDSHSSAQIAAKEMIASNGDNEDITPMNNDTVEHIIERNSDSRDTARKEEQKLRKL